MEDDLAGRAIPTEVPGPTEPLVAFHPDRAVGAPFFAAPEASVGSAPVDEERASVEGSPFLRAPAAVPEKIVPKQHPLSAAPAPKTLPVIPAEEEAAPVVFSLAPQSIRSSLRLSPTILPRFRQSLATIFRDRKMRFVAMAAAFLVVAGIVGGAAWWYWQGKSVLVEQPNTQADSSRKASEIPPERPVQAKYLAEQPNILSFDTETVTAEQIKSTLLQAGQTIQRENLPGAIEFLIRDQKLNPLAFSRFAYLAGLDLPAELLGALDESFSLYVFIDDGRPRVALLVYLKDETVFAAELKKNEKNLAQAIDPLFLDVTTAPKTNLVFRDGAYLERPVRFVNVDPSLGLSVDHAVRGRQWILGTSKDSLRAVLDKTGL